jgi:glycerophosphoryl diester phosphodiesterase
VNAGRLIHLVAHRGNAAEFPENTLPAFHSALQLGVRFLELDVQLSRDGVPVVIHDHLLARTTGQPGSVFDLDAAQLAQLHATDPLRGGEAHAEARVPLLTEVLPILRGRPEVTLFVEIKAASLRQFGHDYVVSRVLEAVGGWHKQCVIISFDLTAVHRARELGRSPVGWVLPDCEPHSRLKWEALQPDFLFCDHVHLPAQARLWPGPWRWAVYEVDSLPLALSLAARGADYIETMAVRAMSEALRAQRGAP